MSSQHHPSNVPSGSDVIGTSVRDMPSGNTDDAVADMLIGAVRACSPDSPASIEYVRTALVDYVDAARLRSEPPERTTATVRFMASTILTSAVWSGENRDSARELIRMLVAVCTERLAGESPGRA